MVYALLFMLIGTAMAATEVGSFTAPLIATLGGTGKSSYTQGSLLVSTSTTVVGEVTDVATGQVLTSGGTSTVPAYSGTPTVTSVTLSGNTAKSFLYSDSASLVAATTAPSNGEILIGDTGNIPAKATLTQGAGITITNGAHSITIAASGGGNKTVTAKTGNYSVLSGDAGVVFTNTGAAGTVIFTLPTAASGLNYTFYVDAVHVVEVLAGASTTIQLGGSISSSAGNFQAGTSGYCVTVVAISTTQWVATAITGNWVGA